MVTIDYIQNFFRQSGNDEMIKENTNLSELEIDSITMVELLNTIEEDFNIIIPWSDIENNISIGEFCRKINNL